MGSSSWVPQLLCRVPLAPRPAWGTRGASKAGGTQRAEGPGAESGCRWGGGVTSCVPSRGQGGLQGRLCLRGFPREQPDPLVKDRAAYLLGLAGIPGSGCQGLRCGARTQLRSVRQVRPEGRDTCEKWVQSFLRLHTRMSFQTFFPSLYR